MAMKKIVRILLNNDIVKLQLKHEVENTCDSLQVPTEAFHTTTDWKVNSCLFYHLPFIFYH